MPRSTNRDLLFGLLALQNNFIDRDALIDAFHRWSGDRSRPLDELLLDRRALTPGRHAIVAELAEEHVKLHGGDPEKSLAALASIGAVRDDLSRIADPGLHASMALVSTEHSMVDEDRFRTVLPTTLGGLENLGARFRVLRPHARGGLGEVFLAYDAELDRDVALKVLQDQFADDLRYRSRFELEARVTGGLEHPGIVPVHSLGHASDGRPFYAMRFIRGKTLKEAINDFHEAEGRAERDMSHSILELRGLLARFIDVCNAVAYAHSRGVLHRDIKPGNIMLGPFGETLVVDWGLAKAVDEREEATPAERPEMPLNAMSGSGLQPTLAGEAMGTPAYMSPEQVDSRAGRPGVRSDVYCLGATLYHILTGRAPTQAEQVGDAFQKILEGDIPRPRSIKATIAPALEAICVKAMAVDPLDRYATAHELKADLERWLAGEPVSCHRESLLERMWRSGRRNPWVVRGVGLATIFFIMLFIFSSIVFAVLGLVWAILGAAIGTVVGAAQGQARMGARRGAQFGFQVGTILAIVVFLIYGFFLMARQVIEPWLR